MGGGANATDPSANTVHGTNPQFLVHNILRQRIYESAWWKEHCFALSGATAKLTRCRILACSRSLKRAVMSLLMAVVSKTLSQN